MNRTFLLWTAGIGEMVLDLILHSDQGSLQRLVTDSHNPAMDPQVYINVSYAMTQ
jgi:hypothetical protein